jgi:tetratricopeptide (TPR) repeat protein
MIGEATNSSQTVRKMIQSYFTALGLDLSPPKVILLNKRVGELYVRATLSDLQLIQKAVERLNHSPAQQPSEEDVQRLQEIEKKKREVAPLVQEGKLLYEMGQFDQAEKIFVQVVKDDPSNGSAPYFLDLIKEARYMQRADELHPRPPARQRESLRHPNPMPDTNVVNITKGRQRILAKLDTIMFDEVSYDLPLKDVLARLQKKSQKRDPDGEGVNFMLVNPIAAVPTQQQDIGADVRIRISPALSKVRLEDVLQAITKSADKPIRYTIEDYGVVFWPK